MHARIQEFSSGGGGGGGGGRLSSDDVSFINFFWVLSLVNFKEIYHFSRFQRGSNIFQGGGGGPTFSRRGGSNCLFPVETQITCDIPWGSGPLESLWIRTCSASGKARNRHPRLKFMIGNAPSAWDHHAFNDENVAVSCQHIYGKIKRTYTSRNKVQTLLIMRIFFIQTNNLNDPCTVTASF